MPSNEECNLQCPETRPYLEVPHNQGSWTTRLVQCVRCGVVMEWPRPPKAEIDAFYASQDLWTHSRDAEGNSRSYMKEWEAKKPLFQDLVNRIERRKHEGTLLDIGSGPGLLERVLDPKRWQVTGVEMAAFAAEWGRREMKTHVLTGKFEEIDFGNRRFDVIVLKYVLDHMEEPFRVLQKLRTRLKPDGLLVLADLINIDSFGARFFGPGYRLIHPMHFTYFSPATIGRYLDRLGLRVLHIDFPYLRTPYFTASNIASFAGRVAKRLFQMAGGRPQERIFSTAFYGNMMDVWAAPINSPSPFKGEGKGEGWCHD